MEFYKSYKDSMDPEFDIPGWTLTPNDQPISGWKKPWQLSTTTNPFGANQLEELGKKMNEGIENVEVGTLKLSNFETIPETHFEEIRRLAEITNTGISFHAPLDIDPSGLSDKGRWSEQQRIHAERLLTHVLQRTAKITPMKIDKETNKKVPMRRMPVVLHAGSTMSQEYEKGLKYSKVDKNGRLIRDEKGNPILVNPKDNLGIRTMAIINPLTGEVTQVQHKNKYSLETGKEEVWDVNRLLDNINESQWDQEKLKVLSLQNDLFIREDMIAKRADEMSKANAQIEWVKTQGIDNTERGKQIVSESKWTTRKNEIEIKNLNSQIQSMTSNLASSISDIHDTFRKGIDKKDKKLLEAADELVKINDRENQKIISLRKQIEKQLPKIKDEQKRNELIGRFHKMSADIQSEKYKILSEHIGKLETPRSWISVNDFSKEQASTTIANAITKAYQRVGDKDKLPLLALENFFPETPLSTASDLKEAVDKTRKKLAKNLVKEKLASKNEAKQIASELMGATWDIGHITALRKAGFEGKELKEKLIQETRTIAPKVKHLHITDNFGFHDSHLPPGMGIVPVEEMVKELEEAGFAGLGVEESGGFIEGFKEMSTPYSREFFGSPIYGLRHHKTIPYGTFSEPSIMFPQQHFNLYGSSFSTLPSVFGGQVGGENSRFSGTPNQ